MGKGASLMIFVVGNSRSGTTMLGRIFNNHSLVHTFGELHFFENQVGTTEVLGRPALSTAECVALLERLLTSAREGLFARVVVGTYREDAKKIITLSSGNDAVSLYEAFLLHETRRAGKTIPCEQTPRYLFAVKEILQLFPEAHVINLVRDPRDVLLSQKNKWRRRFLGAKNIPMREAVRSWANYHPFTISKLWVAAVRAAKRLEGHPRFTTLKFEDLLAFPEETMKGLCRRIGIGYESEMLNVALVGSSTGKDRPQDFGIDRTRSGIWRRGGLTETELSICQRVTRDDMCRLGYEMEQVATPVWRVGLSMGSAVLKGALALVLNLHRVRNLREAIGRRFGTVGGAA